MRALLVVVLATRPVTAAGVCAGAFQQCGGVGYQGSTCCMDGCKCLGHDKYYHQCVPPHGLQQCDVVAAAKLAEDRVAEAAASVSRCAAMGEKCTDSMCCNSPALSCYEKNETWAVCNTKCAKGGDSDDGKPWSCKHLDRSPDNIFHAGTKDCGWGEEMCSKSNCCKIQGMGCYEKNPYWAACKKVCVPGVDPRESDGFDWSCRARTAPKLTHLRAPEPGATRKPMGTSLFCITVVMPTTFEVELVDKQKELGAGVFSCEASAVFQAAALPHKDKSDGVVRPKDFIQIWEEIRANRNYKSHDWTVKADPDTVFFAQRLRHHLTRMDVPLGASVYIRKTVVKDDQDVLNIGALHVMSHAAIEAYFMSHDVCSKKLIDFGEDFYLMTCLDQSDVGHIVDVHLLNDAYAVRGDDDWPDGRLSVYGDEDGSTCRDDRWVALHPIQNTKDWVTCYANGNGTLAALKHLRRVRQ